MTRVLVDGALFTLCAALAFVPQMIAWHSIYGSWLAVSPIGPQIRWTDPQLADILWSSRNGLLSWSPILYVGAIGLILFAVSVPAVGIPALLIMAVMTYFNASIQDWWGSDGFGGRRFDGTIPLFCLGIAAFARSAVELTRRHPLRVVAAGGALLVLWNLTLMSAAQSGLFRIGTPVSFGETGIGAGTRLPQLVRQSLHVSRQPRVRAAQRVGARALRSAVGEPVPRRSAASVRPRGHRRRRRGG